MYWCFLCLYVSLCNIILFCIASLRYCWVKANLESWISSTWLPLTLLISMEDVRVYLIFHRDSCSCVKTYLILQPLQWGITGQSFIKWKHNFNYVEKFSEQLDTTLKMPQTTLKKNGILHMLYLVLYYWLITCWEKLTFFSNSSTIPALATALL